MLIIFISTYQKAYIQNLVKNDPVLSAKIRFSFSNVNNLGSRSKMISGYFKKSYTFIYSVSCLHFRIFSSKTVVGFEKYTVFSFSYRKA